MKLDKDQAYQLQNLDGFLKGMNITILLVEPGRASISVPLDEEVCRFGGIMNGGAVLTFCDYVGALSTMALQDVLNNLTVSMNADFLSPVDKGPVIFNAKVEREGKNLAFVTIEVIGEDGNMCARVSGIWRIFR